MARNNKRNEKKPDELTPGKAQVPDIRRGDTDLLKRGRTEKGDTQTINYDNKETPNPGRAERGEQGPPDENVTP